MFSIRVRTNSIQQRFRPLHHLQLLGLESPIRSTINCAEVASILMADKSLR